MERFNQQTGQTLIETMAALFILVTGVSASVGLAIYALNSSTSIVKQIVGTGLAREGIEAVRNMRDTNWLKQDAVDTNCYNFEDLTAPNSQDGQCYKFWLGDANLSETPFCLNPTNNAGNCAGGAGFPTQDYALWFDYTNPIFWTLARQRGQDSYGLTFDATNSLGRGFYYTNGNTNCTNAAGMAEYCRKIIINKNTTSPYDTGEGDVGPLLEVRVRVWWVDKKCPRLDDWDESVSKVPPASCRIELQTYLTNWKDY